MFPKFPSAITQPTSPNQSADVGGLGKNCRPTKLDNRALQKFCRVAKVLKRQSKMFPRDRTCGTQVLIDIYSLTKASSQYDERYLSMYVTSCSTHAANEIMERFIKFLCKFISTKIYLKISLFILSPLNCKYKGGGAFLRRFQYTYGVEAIQA